MSFLFDMQSTQVMWPSTYTWLYTSATWHLNQHNSLLLQVQNWNQEWHWEARHTMKQLEILQVSLPCTQILMQNKWVAHCPHKIWQLGGSQPDQTSVQGLTATPMAAPGGTIPLAPTVLSSWAAKPSPAKAEQPAKSKSFWPVLLYKG